MNIENGQTLDFKKNKSTKKQQHRIHQLVFHLVEKNNFTGCFILIFKIYFGSFTV